MGESKEIRISEYEHHHLHPSIQINGYPRDLLQRFRDFPAELGTKKKTEDEDEEEEELNLGLSLGSLFGVKGPSENRLVRSSSIAGLTSLFREEDVSLIRTCSLPAEAEEDRRKRKEMQSLRRLEAKRKRSEKQRNCRVKDRVSLDEEDKRAVVAAAAGGGGEEEEGLIVNKGLKQKVEESTGIQQQQQQQQQYMVSNGFSSSMVHPFRPPNWASPSSQVTAAAAQRIDPGSQGSSSSGTCEIEGRPAHQGSSSCTEARSPKSVQSLPEQSQQKPVVAPTTTPPNTEKSSMSTGVEVDNPSNKPKVNDNGSREMGMKMMEEMPGCWTTGSGPNGKRIEGLLYNYRKGEEVRIVCVCHGSFLTPAEFVKHAGGGDTENPLRHIIVNYPSSSSS